MKTTIYLVRHSNYSNPDGLVPGRIPGYHLSEEGEEKAKKLGKFFQNRKISAIYTSPLERAYETANIISEFLSKAKITHLYNLIELESSLWQAYKLESLFTNESYETFLNEPDSRKLPENLVKLAERMNKTISDLLKKHKGEEIICVSHMYPIIALRLTLEGKPLILARNYEASIASVTTFTFDQNGNYLKTDYRTVNDQ